MNNLADACLVSKDNTIGNQKLTPDWVKWLWTSPVDKFNVTVIEFSPTTLSILSQKKYERLAPKDPVVNEVVRVFQYWKGSIIIGNGIINKVIGRCHRIYTT